MRDYAWVLDGMVDGLWFADVVFVLYCCCLLLLVGGVCLFVVIVTLVVIAGGLVGYLFAVTLVDCLLVALGFVSCWLWIVCWSNLRLRVGLAC